jgi:hypothetical protein
MPEAANMAPVNRVSGVRGGEFVENYKMNQVGKLRGIYVV